MLIGIWDRANCVTLLGLTLSTLAMVLAATGRANWALVCLAWSGTCDLYDGLLARTVRRTEVSSTFGSQLDSIVDMASFGVAPVVMLRCLWLREWFDLPILIVYVGCAAVRLAFFNTLAITSRDGEKASCYRGLPVTFVAWILPAALLASRWVEARLLLMGLRLLVLALAFLFILDFRVPRLGMASRLVLTATTVALTVAWWGRV